MNRQRIEPITFRTIRSKDQLKIDGHIALELGYARDQEVSELSQAGNLQREYAEVTGSLEISDGVAESLSLHRICEARIDPQQLTLIRRYQIKREPLCSIPK